MAHPGPLGNLVDTLSPSPVLGVEDGVLVLGLHLSLGRESLGALETPRLDTGLGNGSDNIIDTAETLAEVGLAGGREAVRDLPEEGAVDEGCGTESAEHGVGVGGRGRGKAGLRNWRKVSAAFWVVEVVQVWKEWRPTATTVCSTSSIPDLCVLGRSRVDFSEGG